MISYGKHYIDQDDIKSVSDSLKSKYITQGPNVSLFEEQIKKIFKAKGTVAVSSGTAALHLSGIALNWKPNDLVLTVPLTFIATANAVLYSGAKLGLVDIDEKTLNIDLNLLEEKIKNLRKKRKKIKSIIAVDYAGNPCEWGEIKYLSKKYGFTVINDNCHAIGSKYKKSIGYAAKYADLVTHSYHAVKNITTGEGGSVLSLDKKKIEKIKDLRTHGLKYFNSSKSKLFYDMQSLGFNYRLTDFQSALGISQLKKLNKFIHRRRQIAKIYDDAFQDNQKLIVPPVSTHSTHSYHLYPLQIKFDEIKISKKDLFIEMKKNNIILQSHYLPIYRHSFYKKKFNYKDFPVSESFYKRQVSLPIYYSLKNTEVNKVIKLIKYFIK
jgi:dTDP-4-amino-4,6-dideoxygalactose transaminase|tara:strand:+ start:3831 stop:4973 length:1143 start_codon:yes stop_codon:yes gene_type:complete